jgi:uncharacterized membrane protein YdjX (TVP38/TMEM64 family)
MSESPRHRLLSRLPLVLVAFAAVAGAVLFRDSLGPQALARHADRLSALRDDHYGLTAVLFVLAYVAIVALSLPGATLATLTGGFLFGLFPGVLFNVTAASAGAVLIFLAARSGLGRDVATRLTQGGGAGARALAAIRRNEWWALLTMRLIPVLPFFAANLIPAFAGVRLRPFAVTTVLGILPGALILTSLGQGLREVLAQGGQPDLSVLGSPRLLLPLFALAGLSLLPVFLRRRAGRGEA